MTRKSISHAILIEDLSPSREKPRPSGRGCKRKRRSRSVLNQGMLTVCKVAEIGD